MPEHLITGPKAAGRLVSIDIVDDATPRDGLTIYAAHKRDRALGRAGRWLLDELRRHLALTSRGSARKRWRQRNDMIRCTALPEPLVAVAQPGQRRAAQGIEGDAAPAVLVALQTTRLPLRTTCWAWHFGQQGCCVIRPWTIAVASSSAKPALRCAITCSSWPRVSLALRDSSCLSSRARVSGLLQPKTIRSRSQSERPVAHQVSVQISALDVPGG